MAKQNTDKKPDAAQPATSTKDNKPATQAPLPGRVVRLNKAAALGNGTRKRGTELGRVELAEGVEFDALRAYMQQHRMKGPVAVKDGQLIATIGDEQYFEEGQVLAVITCNKEIGATAGEIVTAIRNPGIASV